jgi:hypothetical protein
MPRLNDVPIRNFSRASGTVFRGCVPDQDGLQFIASLGIKTVVDLRSFGEKTATERALASECNLNYFNIPLNLFGLPDTVVAPFLAVVLQPDYQPIYLHCTEDQTRSAALIGIYRIAVEGWPFEWAYEEMRNRGFPPWQIFLKSGVRNFARRITPLSFQQRVWALHELVESNIFHA